MPLLSTFANAGARAFGFAGAGSPNAPTIGTATATSNIAATVSFTAPLSNGGSPITSYTAVSSPGGITGTLSQAGSGTITVTGLSPRTSYTFTVYATNALGNSPSSAASNSIETFGVPDAPTIGTATAVDQDTATVSYTAPAYNGGATITSYTAVSSPGSITGTRSSATSGTITVNGLSSGTTYTFRVYATNTYGNSPNSSASNSITTPNPITISVTPTSFSLGPMTVGQWLYRNITITASGGNGTITVQETSRPSSWILSVDGVTSNSPDGYAVKNFTLSGGQQISVQLGLQYGGAALNPYATFAAVNTPTQGNIVITMNVP